MELWWCQYILFYWNETRRAFYIDIISWATRRTSQAYQLKQPCCRASCEYPVSPLRISKIGRVLWKLQPPMMTVECSWVSWQLSCYGYISIYLPKTTHYILDTLGLTCLTTWGIFHASVPNGSIELKFITLNDETIRLRRYHGAICLARMGLVNSLRRRSGCSWRVRWPI